ncbi:hypothetical protein MMC26_003077 [Xylographa opegraphella]|nr:hypothetical protein [Xylographa opegraphella]
MPPPKIHTHPSPRHTLLPHLLPLLPSTLPLVRRLQFHFQSPHATVLCTLPPSTPPTTPPPPFAALYVDRSRAPETECWLFSTHELPTPAPQNAAAALPHFLALLGEIPHLPLPATYPSTQDPSRLLLGAVHRSVLETLAGSPLAPHAGKKVISGPGAASATDEWRGSAAASSGCVRGHTVAYQKFLFESETVARAAAGGDGSDGEPLLGVLGLEWTSVREGEYGLVASRTEIPRSGRTMRLLGSVGLRRRRRRRRQEGGGGASEREGEGEGQLVAWAFLGPDGSLTSLHVEPEFRGRGLGKLVTRRLFALLGEGGRGSGFEDVREGEEWCHSDVATDNAGSIGVARGLGGEEGWECFWAWVDLEEVERMSGALDG